jgi:hypothetical protein
MVARDHRIGYIRTGRLSSRPDARRHRSLADRYQMKIAFDSVNNRATDLTTGMTVAYLREDYPLEHGQFWMLAWKGEEYEFRVGWENGYVRIVSGRPDISDDEARKLTRDLNLMEYEIPLVRTGLNERDFLNNIDLFIDLFSTVARNRLHSRNIHVIFRPGGVRKQFHRDVQFPPLDAAG